MNPINRTSWEDSGENTGRKRCLADEKISPGSRKIKAMMNEMETSLQDDSEDLTEIEAVDSVELGGAEKNEAGNTVVDVTKCVETETSSFPSVISASLCSAEENVKPYKVLNTKHLEIIRSNIQCAKSLSDAIRTGLGPCGLDKMILDGQGGVTITQDGATILKLMNVVHPDAKMLVELCKAQDIAAGDGK